MDHPQQQLAKFMHERGTTSVEYGLLISLIGGVVAVALTSFGPAVAALFSNGLDALL